VLNIHERAIPSIDNQGIIGQQEGSRSHNEISSTTKLEAIDEW